MISYYFFHLMVRFITILNNNTRILSSSKVVRINKKTYQLFLFCVNYALISLWCLMEIYLLIHLNCNLEIKHPSLLVVATDFKTTYSEYAFSFNVSLKNTQRRVRKELDLLK